MTHGIANIERPPDSYIVEISGIMMTLPKFKTESGVTIAVLNLLGGDPLIIKDIARDLASKILRTLGCEPNYPTVLVTPEAKSIPFCYELAIQMAVPYVVLRKSYKSYMGKHPLTVTTHSITTGKDQKLILDDKDRQFLEGKKTIIVDDVLSTGSTVGAMMNLLDEVEADLVGVAVVAVEGEKNTTLEALGIPVYWLVKLPIWGPDG